jgi:hypothetical protein
VEPQFGNHFGFYEGGIFEAFSNKTSYTYPAKVATEFFAVILEELSAADMKSTEASSSSSSSRSVYRSRRR